ncbi:coagulation factor IX-like [Mya arenaria]|uniref:coagulation factor IX-like n=1 Tax=Mya arenaria TaxID=6604 RepID=UPI0022E88824|nr:coagulation factor IX-like [Mya arenaria]
MWWNYVIYMFIFFVVFGCEAQTRSEVQASLPVVLDPRDNRDDVSSNIVGGQDAEKDEYIYQVYFTKNARFFCSGLILDKETVLTAVHCFEDGINNGVIHHVVAGDYEYNTYEGTEQIRTLRAIAKHPDYESSDFMSPDLAVIKLTKPFTFNEHVTTAKKRERRARKGGNCWVTGRGAISQGGPIVCFLKDQPVLMGIVSWSGGDCAAYGFSAYSRPRSHRNWIRNQVANL